MKSPVQVVLILILLLISFLFRPEVAAQPDTAPGGSQIRGVVVDSLSGKPLEFLTVSLLNEQNDVIKTSYSVADGSFAVATAGPGAYRLAVDGVGYKRKLLPANLAEQRGVLDLGVMSPLTATPSYPNGADSENQGPGRRAG